MTWLPNLVAAALLITLSITSGCREEGPKMPPVVQKEDASRPAVLTLTWSGFDGSKLNDPENAVYIVNGNRKGTGTKGFWEVLEAIESCPNGCELLVFPDRTVLGTLTLLGGVTTAPDYPDTVPFRQQPELLSALRETAKSRRISIWYLAGAPGEYTTSDGNDLRVAGNSR